MEEGAKSFFDVVNCEYRKLDYLEYKSVVCSSTHTGWQCVNNLIAILKRKKNQSLDWGLVNQSPDMEDWSKNEFQNVNPAGIKEEVYGL